MNILYLNHNFENEGTFYRCFFIARELVKIGHTVTIITVSNNSPQYIVKTKIRDGVKIVLLPSAREKKDFFFYILRPLLSLYFVLTEKYDVIHAFAVARILTAFPFRIMSIIKRTEQLFVDWDDFYSEDGFCRLRPFTWVMVPLMNYLEQNIPKHADKITVVSTFLNDKAKEYGLNNVNIFQIPNSCDTEGIKPLNKKECRKIVNLEDDKIVLVYMGRVHHSFKKLYDSFIKLELKGILLLCIGEFNEPYDRKENVLFTGHIGHEEISYYLGAADILLMPMENNSIEKARWPIRFGDYLSAGRPVVSTGIGEVGKTIEKYRCGINVNRTEDMCSESLKILEDKEKIDRFKINARKAAEELSWMNAAKEMNKLYEQ